MFYKLKSHITSLLVIQNSNIAQLAVENPGGLSSNPQFKKCAEKRLLLSSILDEAEKIETSA